MQNAPRSFRSFFKAAAASTPGPIPPAKPQSAVASTPDPAPPAKPHSGEPKSRKTPTKPRKKTPAKKGKKRSSSRSSSKREKKKPKTGNDHYRTVRIGAAFLRDSCTAHSWLRVESRETALLWVSNEYEGSFVPDDEIEIRKMVLKTRHQTDKSSRTASSDQDACAGKDPKVENRQFAYCHPCREYLVSLFALSKLGTQPQNTTINDFRQRRFQLFSSKYSFSFGLLVPNDGEFRKSFFKLSNHESTKFHKKAESAAANLLQKSLTKSAEVHSIQVGKKQLASQLGVVTLLQLALHGRPLSAMREALELFDWQLDILEQGVPIPGRSQLRPTGWAADNNGKLTRCLQATVRQLQSSPRFHLGQALSPGLKSLVHDATTHQRKHFVAIASRHLNTAGTRAHNTFVGLLTTSRQDAVSESNALLPFLKSKLLHLESKEGEPTTLRDRGLVGIGRDGASVNKIVDRRLNDSVGMDAKGSHCATHRSHLVTTRSTRSTSKCKEFRNQASFYCNLLGFFEASCIRISMLEETQLDLSLDPLLLLAWSPVRMNHLYAANSRILRRLVAVQKALVNISQERKDDRAKAKGFAKCLSSIPVIYLVFLIEIVGTRLLPLTKTLDSDDVLVCEVYSHAQNAITNLEFAKNNVTPREKMFFNQINKDAMTFSGDGGSIDVHFPGGRRPQSWDSLQRLKSSVFTALIADLRQLYPNSGPERVFAVFDLRALATSKPNDEEQDLLAEIADEYARDKTVQSEEFGETRLPSVCDTGENHIELLDEYCMARPELSRSGSAVLAGQSQALAYELFLLQFGVKFPRLAALLRVMLVFPVNSSVIERAFSHLKELMNAKRCRLSPEQLNRLLLLKLCLPKMLAGVDVSAIAKSM